MILPASGMVAAFQQPFARKPREVNGAQARSALAMRWMTWGGWP